MDPNRQHNFGSSLFIYFEGRVFVREQTQAEAEFESLMRWLKDEDLAPVQDLGPRVDDNICYEGSLKDDGSWSTDNLDARPDNVVSLLKWRCKQSLANRRPN